VRSLPSQIWETPSRVWLQRAVVGGSCSRAIGVVGAAFGAASSSVAVGGAAADGDGDAAGAGAGVTAQAAKTIDRAANPRFLRAIMPLRLMVTPPGGAARRGRNAVRVWRDRGRGLVLASVSAFNCGASGGWHEAAAAV